MKYPQRLVKMVQRNLARQEQATTEYEQTLVDEMWERIARLCGAYERELGYGMDYRSQWYEDILKQIEYQEKYK